MLTHSGNPIMSNISAVFAAIKRKLKVEVHTQVVLASGKSATAVANPKNVDWFERNANERLLRESFRFNQACKQVNNRVGRKNVNTPFQV
jgi:hypothetical protein